ncbi:MAG TPA: hypothetical protein ENH13_01185 [Euryarchaeota archaeon]|nr:hypothetical protein [Euryarchaeota archaeon]
MYHGVRYYSKSISSLGPVTGNQTTTPRWGNSGNRITTFDAYGDYSSSGNYTTEARDSGSGNDNKNLTLILSDYNQSKANVSIYVDKNDGNFVLVQKDITNATAYSIDPADRNQTYRIRLLIETKDVSYTPLVEKIEVQES